MRVKDPAARRVVSLHVPADPDQQHPQDRPLPFRKAREQNIVRMIHICPRLAAALTPGLGDPNQLDALVLRVAEAFYKALLLEPRHNAGRRGLRHMQRLFDLLKGQSFLVRIVQQHQDGDLRHGEVVGS